MVNNGLNRYISLKQGQEYAFQTHRTLHKRKKSIQLNEVVKTFIADNALEVNNTEHFVLVAIELE